MSGPPSPLFTQEAARLREAARRGPVVDLACGRGRHALAAARLGLPVLGLDRSREFLAELLAGARRHRLPLAGVRVDLENGPGLPLRAGSCGAILVFRFLFRPLAPAIVEALSPGGLLLYETFTLAQRAQGWGPRNAAFLLGPGELPALFPDLEVLAGWEGVVAGERPEAVARLVARKPG